MDTDPSGEMVRFWQAAASPVPVLIVGGGRWGKVWASVLSGAQESSKHLLIAARTDPEAVRVWADSDASVDHLVVCESIAEAVAQREELAMAIVCSRPQDHERDVLEAFRYGLHVLVEKPISTTADSAMRMLLESQRVQRKLVVGTEFAYIPALHQCAHEWRLSARDSLEVRVCWEDPALETRYGSSKSRHPEVDALGDLLPHAFSIFRVLAPGRDFRVAGVSQSGDGQSGWIRFQDPRSGVFTLVFDLAAGKRKRCVEVAAGRDRVVIDFNEKRSSMTVNQRPHTLDPRLFPLTSTLRLQWGAFITSLCEDRQQPEVDPSIPALIQLQRELESFSR
ncbi:Gfo/Idh/MocA family protein [Hydrogenophaga sp.]|uniref:Gfo/Idh/MocA family protein n=1 Tax=Hydrogenophaga sp. TaxID=1904254 RepID=UPI0027248637|nr:Gfo/Idh/MocA family oxidoreductase [Hydrogenophaga sp.]MDO9436511.1 Gfo/Idh/MocA family oxidoreductase [Hydrogenophaga sp.]